MLVLFIFWAIIGAILFFSMLEDDITDLQFCMLVVFCGPLVWVLFVLFFCIVLAMSLKE